MSRYLWVFIATVIGTSAWACDQCSVTLGSEALSEGHFIGYRFKYRRQITENLFKTKSLGKHLDHVEEQGVIKELYYTHELFGNFHVKGNWHLSVGIPLVNNYRSINALTSDDITGVGDAWFIIRNQQIWQRDEGRTVFSGGLGAKLATGSTGMTYAESEVDLDMQPGSGSMDLLANVVLLYDYKRWFVMTQQSIKVNGSSPGDYRYGSTWNSSVDIGWTAFEKEGSPFKVNVRTGPFLEWTGRDEQEGIKQGETSYQLFLNGGVQIRRQRILAGIQGLKEIHSELDPRILPTTDRLLVSLQYEF